MSPHQFQRIRTKLEEQFRFLCRSAELFDNGCQEEAIRMATSLRVMFHQTTQSTSLVNHLNWTNRKMLSSTRGYGDWRDYLAHVINLRSAEPVTVRPVYGNRFVPTSIREWWQIQPVFAYEGTAFPRKKIILSAANKDGGAHVDHELEEYYEFLTSGKYLLGITRNLESDGTPAFPQGVTIYPKNPHLSLIRQFTHEAIQTVLHYRWL